MGQQTRFHSIAIHLVLIAIAVQGITPDLQDLASQRALHLLCPFLDPSDDWEDGDDPTDDVSGPVRPGPSVVTRMLLDRATDPRSESARSTLRMIQSDALQAARRRSSLVRMCGLVHLLCRLTC
jgi:hypothetical protein